MRILMALLLSFTLAVPALAAFEGPGSAVQVKTVAQALQAADDAPCVLEGAIVEKVTGSDDNYVFQDASGRIVVDIDSKIFSGRTVTPNSKIRLTGKVDKKTLKPNEVDVKALDVLQ